MLRRWCSTPLARADPVGAGVAFGDRRMAANRYHTGPRVLCRKNVTQRVPVLMWVIIRRIRNCSTASSSSQLHLDWLSVASRGHSAETVIDGRAASGRDPLPAGSIANQFRRSCALLLIQMTKFDAAERK